MLHSKEYYISSVILKKPIFLDQIEQNFQDASQVEELGLAYSINQYIWSQAFHTQV